MTRQGRIAAVILTAVFAVTILAPLLAPADPLRLDIARRFHGIGPQHLLGTDEFGRDTLARLLHGGRVSLSVALGAVVFALAAGATLGLMAGLAGGWFDRAVILGCDVVLAFPGILLALLLIAMVGPSQGVLIVAIGILYTPVFLRLTRSSMLRLREADFVQACRLLGVSRPVILFGEILPNILPPLAAQSVTSLAWALIAETALSFLGLGAQPPTPSWGSMLASARDYLDYSGLLALAPATAILITVWAANILADSLGERGI